MKYLCLVSGLLIVCAYSTGSAESLMDKAKVDFHCCPGPCCANLELDSKAEVIAMKPGSVSIQKLVAEADQIQRRSRRASKISLAKHHSYSGRSAVHQ